MENNPLISIIIPVYNTEKYLSDCIDSVLSQTYNNFELILVDDGSNDQSGDICDEYAKSDSRVLSIHQENSGVSVARNQGISVANGDYLAFIDSDDIVHRDFLKTLINEIAIKDIDLIICQFTKDESCIKNDNWDRNIKEGRSYNIKDATLKMINGGLSWCPFGKLYKTNIIKENALIFDKNIAFNEDMLFNLSYLSLCNGIIMELEDCLYFYRDNPNSSCSKRFDKNSKNIERKISVYRAYTLAKKIFDDSEINTSIELRRIAGAVVDLRLIVATKFSRELKHEMLHYIRRNQFLYYSSRNTIKSKISVMLSSISPELEFYVWKHIHH